MQCCAGLRGCLLFLSVLVACANDDRSAQPGFFVMEFELTLPGDPEIVYDAATGDISGWWDHSFSERPAKLYIEPRPGGGFYEIFDESGDGVRHATVIFAHRGKFLRFEGPLGLSGRAVMMAHSYSFEPAGADSTLMRVAVHASGEIDTEVAKTVERVWHHFLFERFKPYVESGMNPLPK